MSLSAWEQQILDSMKDRLADSDPQLVALLTTYAQLASGEEMPAREKIRASSGWAIRRSQRNTRRSGRDKVRRYARRVYQRLGLRRVLLPGLSVTVALIAVVLALATSAIKAMLGHREEGASVTTDVARGEHERYAGRAAPDRAGPPGQELPSAGTGQLNQIAASATHPPIRHLPWSRAARVFTATRIRPSTSRDSSESALRANWSSAGGEPCRQQERPDGRSPRRAHP